VQNLLDILMKTQAAAKLEYQLKNFICVSTRTLLLCAENRYVESSAREVEIENCRNVIVALMRDVLLRPKSGKGVVIVKRLKRKKVRRSNLYGGLFGLVSVGRRTFLPDGRYIDGSSHVSHCILRSGYEVCVVIERKT